MKKISMILFISWSLLLVLILTFGTSTATKITSFFADIIYSNKNALKDVKLENRKFIIEKEYHLDAIVYPNTCSNPDLVFTSLNPEVFTVNDEYIIGNRIDKDITIGTLLVTSKTYPEFRKEIELIFSKSYPKTANVYLYNEYNKKQEDANVYVTKPFSIGVELFNDQGYVSEKHVTYEYDEKYFDFVSNVDNVLTLKPKYYGAQAGVSFKSFVAGIKVIVNGKALITKKVVINPLFHAEEFSNVMLSSTKDESYNINHEVYLNSKMFIELFNGDTKLVTPFTVSTSDESIIKINDNNELEFKKLGTATISITLNNGFTKSYDLTVKNKVVQPKLQGTLLKDDIVRIYQEHTSSIGLIFEDNAYDKWSYDVIGDSITSSIDEHGSIVFEAKKVGESSIIITIDDGIQTPIIKVIKVIVENNPNSKSSIIRSFGRFLAKIAGHMCFFMLEAFLAYFMMMYYKTNKMKLDIIIYFGIGLFLASLTEFIQIFMPGRYPAIKDIIIDMCGYIVGLGCSILFFYIINKIKEKRVINNEK